MESEACCFRVAFSFAQLKPQSRTGPETRPLKVHRCSAFNDPQAVTQRFMLAPGLGRLKWIQAKYQQWSGYARDQIPYLRLPILAAAVRSLQLMCKQQKKQAIKYALDS